MNPHDNVTITAEMYYNFNDHFKCDDKLKKLIDRVGTDKAKTIMYSENGCNNIREEYRYEIDGIRYHKCLCGFRNNKLSFYLDIVEKIDKGILPYSGCYLNQPSKVIEIIKRVSSIKFDIQQEELKKVNNK